MALSEADSKVLAIVHPKQQGKIASNQEKSENGFHFSRLRVSEGISKSQSSQPLTELFIYGLNFAKFLHNPHPYNHSYIMLTRRDVLIELKRMGVKKPFLLKRYLRDFERYIGNYYDFQILKTKKSFSHLPDQNPESSVNKTPISQS